MDGPMVMTSDDMMDAYGPNGPDEEDIANWRLAVERNCRHEAAYELMEREGRADCYCPDCGTQLERRTPEEKEADDERAYEAHMRSISPGGQW